MWGSVALVCISQTKISGFTKIVELFLKSQASVHWEQRELLTSSECEETHGCEVGHKNVVCKCYAQIMVYGQKNMLQRIWDSQQTPALSPPQSHGYHQCPHLQPHKDNIYMGQDTRF